MNQKSLLLSWTLTKLYCIAPQEVKLRHMDHFYDTFMVHLSPIKVISTDKGLEKAEGKFTEKYWEKK